jgi:phosphoribosylformylglycinamidine cyclo-ligase
MWYLSRVSEKHPMPSKTPPPPPPKRSAYAAAGVNIDSKMNGIRAIKDMVAQTATKGVVGSIGNFGGLFASPGSDMLLVASTDGVGTKLKVAVMAKCHNTVGQDLVNHCVNDILVQGAKPLFFLDYIGASSFNADIFKDIVSGLCKACKENGCALLGGETAELPGIYPAGEYDLVGTIVGCVPRKKLITGKKIKAGDIIIGLPSHGLQTNGYSLARKVLFDQCGLTCNDTLPGTKGTVADHLLSIHRSFLKPVTRVLAKVDVRGMAHITGGGFTDNIPRVLPDSCDAVINRASWLPGTLFNFIQQQGKVERDEMYRVFNMGLGYLLVVDKNDVDKTMKLLELNRPVICGKIVKGAKTVQYEG